MRPEDALDDWRQWGTRLRARPNIIGQLGGGRSNHSFLLDSSIGKLVLRISGADAFLPGANRGSEAGIWRAAADSGIAPPLMFTDRGNRYLVSQFIESDLPPDPRSDAAVRNQAFSLLAKCHRMDISAPVIDYTGHIERYWRLIEAGPGSPDPVLEKERGPMQATLAALVGSDTPTGLCHHDPVIENFVGTPGRLYLIDWEYAATGLQIMDYAALAIEWRVNVGTVLANTGLDPGQFEAAKSLYRYICLLWKAATK